jgi:hypothetical protein
MSWRESRVVSNSKSPMDDDSGVVPRLSRKKTVFLTMIGCLFLCVAVVHNLGIPLFKIEGSRSYVAKTHPASVSVKDKNGVMNPLVDNVNNVAAVNDDPPVNGKPPAVPDSLRELAVEARKFVMDRKTEYYNKSLEYRWELRGVGYLYETHGVILAAQLPVTNATPVGSKQAVTIYNVGDNRIVCKKLKLWVRVNGPEIFAGAAVAVTDTDDASSCHWTFDFDVSEPGEYLVDIKLLLWNGDAPIGGTGVSQCEYSNGRALNTSTLKHDGFQGFKMYKPAQMCCEICARTPYCVSWSTPFLRMENPNRGKNGCELYFEPDAPDDALPVSYLWPHRRRRLGASFEFHGTVHANDVSYFCGCGWSFWFT